MLELVGEYEVVLGFLQGYAIGFVWFMGWVLDMYMVILCVVLTVVLLLYFQPRHYSTRPAHVIVGA